MRLHPQLKDIHSRLRDLIEKGEPAALATLIETYGSTPQTPGFSALFTSRGLHTGTLGGGILEKDAETRAVSALQHRESMLYDFALEADLTSPEGAICGGGVRVLIDADPASQLAAFQALVRSREKRIPGALVSWITREADRIGVQRRWVSSGEDIPSAEDPSARSWSEIFECIRSKQPGLFPLEPDTASRKTATSLLFVEPVFPLPRLVIAGAGHIGAALSHWGSRLEFEVTVIDDRPEFACAENLPDADHILVADIGSTLRELPVGSDTYIVIVTRGHRNDGEALRACVASGAAYVGMIGSRNKVALMRDQFIQQGWATAEQWDRVHTPIGLEIQSQTVEEIAVSIAAQLVLERRRATQKSTNP
jgi:xanthine dehydrogenase accessory factor